MYMYICIVHGGWSDWSVGNCSELCDGGIENKTRICNNPVPSCGGINCVGEAVETMECNTLPCIGPYTCIFSTKHYSYKYNFTYD